MVSTYSRQQKMDSCFNGEIRRDCTVCQAHPRNGGQCCFGSKYDPNDIECEDCLHNEDCADLCESRTRRVPVSNRVAVSRTPVRPVSTRTNRSVGKFPESEVLNMQYSDEEPMLSRMAKEGVWGAGIGFFYYLYKFMSNHHWR